MAKLIFIAILMFCNIVFAIPIVENQVPLAIAFKFVNRNVIDAIAGNCPDGYVPGLCQFRFDSFLHIFNFFYNKNTIDENGKCRQVWGLEEE